jgi:hypothetical protein
MSHFKGSACVAEWFRSVNSVHRLNITGVLRAKASIHLSENREFRRSVLDNCCTFSFIAPIYKYHIVVFIYITVVHKHMHNILDSPLSKFQYTNIFFIVVPISNCYTSVYLSYRSFTFI